MGELLCPCLVQGSVGVVYPVRPQEEQPQWRGQLWKPGFSSGRNSVCRAWRLRDGLLICSAGAGASSLSWALLASAWPGGRPHPGLCPGALCARGLLCWICAPGGCSTLRGAAARAPPSCAGCRRVPRGARQPLGSSAHSPGRAVALLLSRGARGHPRPPGSCSNSLEPLSAREGWCSSCVSGTGLSCPGDTRPGLSPAPRGPLPLGCLLFLYFFFPVFLPG